MIILPFVDRKATGASVGEAAWEKEHTTSSHGSFREGNTWGTVHSRRVTLASTAAAAAKKKEKPGENKDRARGRRNWICLLFSYWILLRPRTASAPQTPTKKDSRARGRADRRIAIKSSARNFIMQTRSFYPPSLFSPLIRGRASLNYDIM